MNWKQYELEIYDWFKTRFPDANIRRDIKIFGLYSKVPRQIDILIEENIASGWVRTIVDGKFFSTKVDVNDVESFIGMIRDVEAHKGILITNEGFTEAAINRAHYDQTDVDLDIFNFKDFLQFQSGLAIPYAGSNGVMMPAPLGWVIDGTRREGCIATLYQRGLGLNEAGQHREWMYVNFWQKNEEAKSIEELTKVQEQRILQKFPDAKITYLPTIKRNNAQTLLRKIEIPSYPTPEYTGFVEFKDFIFFAVLFTPDTLARRNIKKLEFLIQKVLPLEVKHNPLKSE